MPATQTQITLFVFMLKYPLQGAYISLIRGLCKEKERKQKERRKKKARKKKEESKNKRKNKEICAVIINIILYLF